MSTVLKKDDMKDWEAAYPGIWDQTEAVIDRFNDKFNKSVALWGVQSREPMGWTAIALDLFDTYEAGRMYSAEDESPESALMGLKTQIEEALG